MVSKKVKYLFVFIFLIFNTGNSFAVQKVFQGSGTLSDLNPSLKWIQLAEVAKQTDNKRMTWEGILPTDSSEKTACKKECLANYGQGIEVRSCENKAWNNCISYMDFQFFIHRECKGNLEKECKECWIKFTQSCYDGAFKSCLDSCN